MDYKIIGQNIKKYRKNNKLTQSELAKKIERTESSIRKYEKGIVEIPMSLLEKIAEQLNISIDELTGNTSEKQSNLSNTDIIGYMAGLNTIRPGDKFTHLVYDIMDKSMETTTKHIIEFPGTTSPKKNPTITINIPRDLAPIDVVRNKMRKGEPLTNEEEQIIENYLQSDDFKAAADNFADFVKSIPDQLHSCFQSLNDAGLEKAIEYIEMLTKIPEYTKKDEE